MDPGWTPEEVCHWARIQDAAHERWMDAVASGDWGHARRADDDHQLAHICMGLRNSSLKVRFSCSVRTADCPALTCMDVLARKCATGPDCTGDTLPPS